MSAFWSSDFWASDFWAASFWAAGADAPDQVAFQLPLTRVKERTAFTATVYFRDRATKSAATPASARYRIDCLTTKRVVQDWTDLTAASSIAISITPTNNKILSTIPTASGIGQRFEKKQLIVESNTGTSLVSKGRVIWTIENVFGVPTRT